VTSSRVLLLLRFGLRSLLLHKLRSSLSILGVVFGVSAVVAMASVGEGARREAVAQIGALGIDTVTVRARPGTGGLMSAGLRLGHAESIHAVVPGVVAVAPVREAAVPVAGGGRSFEADAVGTTPDYRDAARLSLESGRFLASLDLEDRKRVAVLGATVARALFPFGDERGERVSIGGDWFEVIGVLEERAAAKGRPGPIRTRDVNRSVLVPWPVLDHGKDPRPDGVDELVIRVTRAEEVAPTAEVVRSLLVRNADPDLAPADGQGWTALMAASNNGHFDSAKALLEAGASSALRDEAWDTALRLAQQRGHRDVAQLLEASVRSESAPR